MTTHRGRTPGEPRSVPLSVRETNLSPCRLIPPSSIRGKALEKEFLDLLHKGAIKQAPQTPGFYSRLFVVQKDSGSWRPIIDLSTLNTFIVSQPFHMETPQSVLRSIRQGDWMISLDLQDTYFRFQSTRKHVGIFASLWEESHTSSGYYASG